MIPDREWSGIVTVLVCIVVVMVVTFRVAGDLEQISEISSTVVAAVLVVWRAWLIGLRIDESGVAVRNMFSTYQISWPEILCFEDGWRWFGPASHVWALRIVRRDRRAVTSTVACLEGWRANRRKETLMLAVRRAAAQHGVLADLTGDPSAPVATDQRW